MKIKSFPVCEVLYEFDCEPLCYISELDEGLFYCHAVGEAEWAVAPISKTQLEKLKVCEIDILSLFIDRPTALVVNDQGVSIREEYVKDILDSLPQEGVTLYATPHKIKENP